MKHKKLLERAKLIYTENPLLNIWRKKTMNLKKQLLLFSLVLLILPAATQLKVTPNSYLDGRIVFAPLASGTTYMINEAGEVTHTWESNYIPGLAAYWLPGDSIVRSVLVPGGSDIGGQGGGVQIIASDGTLVWEYIYANETHWAHHDICPLPNGNILILARDFRNEDETLEAGRNPFGPTGQNWYDLVAAEHIIEVKPTGPTSGDIVWSWYVWDHLIQDYDQTKQNYGVIAEHPELIDINYERGYGVDWIHANSLDYNPVLDQILISCRNFNEIWVIDHSTTTEEAAGHSGGTSGKGGDLLYRWGNPMTYGAGTQTDRLFYYQHCARWVKDGYPGSGNVIVFNNGWGRDFSSVDELTPPIDGDGNYILISGQSYGPEDLTWTYTKDNFFAFHLSGAERLPNGNTLILQGEKGEFFVVNPNKQIVWTYDYWIPPPVGCIFSPCFVPSVSQNNPDLDVEGSLNWNKVSPGNTVIGQFSVRNIGTGRLNWTISSNITWGTWTFSQTSGYTYPNQPVVVTVTVVAPSEPNSDFEGYIRVQNTNNPNDFDVVPVTLTTPLIKVGYAKQNQKNSV